MKSTATMTTGVVHGSTGSASSLAPNLPGRTGLRLSLARSHAVVLLSVLTLFCGWHRTWPDLNRDFNHLHGFGECQDAVLARTIAEEGLVKLGFATAVS